MNQHSTVVHWAADHHREWLLADAASDRRFPRDNRRPMTPTRVARMAVTTIIAGISRIVDEFEPGPGRYPASAEPVPERMRS
jgi:hypothetical protein